MSGPKTIGGFFQSTQALTLNLVVIMILFFSLAVPAAVEFGYSDDARDENWGIPSGPSGSGVFPVMLLIFIVSFIQFSFAMYSYFNAKETEY